LRINWGIKKPIAIIFTIAGLIKILFTITIALSIIVYRCPKRLAIHLGGNDDVTPNTKNAILDFAILSRIQQLEVTIAGFTSDLKGLKK
jgi:hypothetical protein